MATSKSARTATRPTTFSLRVDEFRNLAIPGVANSKLGTAYISTAELVASLDLDGWLKVNPRVANRNAKGVLTGHVIKGIRETLEGSPGTFALKNQGLFLLVESAQHERKTGGIGELRITLADPDRHGLCNGGHTYAAIRDFAERWKGQDEEQKLSEAFVRLHIFQGISADSHIDMAEGLNCSKQVDDPSLAQLAGKFKGIEKVMENQKGADQIAYHQGDDGDCYITEILRALMFFNGKRFNNRRHPHRLYRASRDMGRQFEADHDTAPSPIALILPRLPDILQLSDRIAKAVPNACKSLNPPFTFGLMSVGKARAGSKEHKDTPLHWIGETTDKKVPNGWLMPMLAAFRANVEWDLAQGIFEWRQPLDDLLPNVINDLVRVCVREYRENKAKPDEMGRNENIYEQCYQIVDHHLDKLEIERLRAAATER